MLVAQTYGVALKTHSLPSASFAVAIRPQNGIESAGSNPISRALKNIAFPQIPPCLPAIGLERAKSPRRPVSNPNLRRFVRHDAGEARDIAALILHSMQGYGRRTQPLIAPL